MERTRFRLKCCWSGIVSPRIHRIANESDYALQRLNAFLFSPLSDANLPSLRASGNRRQGHRSHVRMAMDR